ncbi:MAG TPA: hypothetical protein VIB55_24675, partial [Longimicrobium sp.]
MIHPLRTPLLLLATALTTAPSLAQSGPMSVDASHLHALQLRLEGFAAGLPAAERPLWQDLLLRAATAGPPAVGDVRVNPVLQIGPGGGCEGQDQAAGRAAIIIQGGRTGVPGTGIVVQGGRTPAAGIVVQGGRSPATGPVRAGRAGGRPGTPAGDAPRPTGTAAVAIGPKQDDPSRPGRTGAVCIGPKQDDPAPPPQALGSRLAALATTLPPEERGAMDWLLTRAAHAAEAGRPGTPGGLPPGTTVSL